MICRDPMACLPKTETPNQSTHIIRAMFWAYLMHQSGPNSI